MQLRAGLGAAIRFPLSGVWPGLLLAGLLAGLALLLSKLAGHSATGLAQGTVSPVLLAILLGLGVRNLVAVPAACEDGIRFALNRLLKLGIVLMGLRLSLATVGQVGLDAAPVVLTCIACALFVVFLFSRWLKIAPALAALVAVGTSICGCTAIMAAAPIVRASRTEVCYAVSCVAIFGTLGMLAYPFLSHALFADNPTAAGMFLGVGIHDTAQVVGAGLLYTEYFNSPAGLDAAVLTKLLRNLSLLLVLPALAMRFSPAAGATTQGRPGWWSAFPFFVLGFLAMSGLRTLGDVGDQPLGLMTALQWQALMEAGQQLSGLLLAVAMAAVGLGTDLRSLRSLGFRPAAAGLMAAVTVGAAGLVLISLLV